jgi:membrane protein DedA with SNARE-associated domain/diacylglycerol kinase family enzyme
MQAAAAKPSKPLSRPAIWSIGALAAAAALLFAAGVIPVPDVEGPLEDASETLGAWAYPAVAGFAFLETGAFVGLLAPGETAVIVGGVVAERGGVELLPLIAFVWLAAVAGDLVSFLFGRRLGRPFLERHGPRFQLTPDRLARVDRFYDRHGGKAVLLGRFTGLIRAVSPFVAGASGLRLARFVGWSAAGALLWATTFTLVGYGFSESFAESGETAARIAAGAALGAALVLVAVARVRSGGRAARRGRADQAEDGERAERPDAGAHQAPDEHVEREVHAQVDARQGHGRRDGQRPGTHARTEDRHGGGRGEGGGAVARGEGRVARDRHQRAQVRIGHGRPLAVEGLFEHVHDERRGAGRGGGGREGHRQAAAPHVGPQAQAHQERALDPPRGQHDEHRGEQRVLDGLSGLDELLVDVDDRGHPRNLKEASKVGGLHVAVNRNASGLEDPEKTGRELVAILEELGERADAVVTGSERELWDVLRSAEALDRRVVLVGGDGTLHAAANAPLKRLPELALVPTGRANNVARALGIPVSRTGALAVAAGAPARPIDALRVATPDRFVYAVEAVSAGFQAEARSGYEAENSADLVQGLKALVRAVRRYRPYAASVDLGAPAPASGGSAASASAAARSAAASLRSSDAAQLFLSNLPYFGFGFEVDPGADPSDGRLEAILLEARGRGRLLRLLAAARRGRHIGRRGVRRVSATRARLTEPLPLVADAVPLGVSTATVSVEPARLRVASPHPGTSA